MQRVLVGFAALCLLGLGLSAAAPATPAAPVHAAGSPAGSPAARATTGSFGQLDAPTGPVFSVDGIDVSDHQKTIDWARVAATGKRFAYVRATAGTRTADRMSALNLDGARAAGLAVGSYHFANPTAAPDDARLEAEWFLAHASIASGDLVPVLDLERANGLTSDQLIAWTRAWLDTVTVATGVRPMIYASPVFWLRSMANTDAFARDGSSLWVAHWTAGGPIPPAWNWNGDGWLMWQHSNRGRVDGIRGRVDLDRVAGIALPEALFVR